MSAADFYAPSASTLTRDTLARAEVVQAQFTAISGAFGKLPDLSNLRALMGLAVVAGGTADALTITSSFAQTAYALGSRITFKAAAANTGAVTVNVDGIGVKALKTHGGAALAAGDLASGNIYEAIYDGTDFRLSGGGLDADVNAAAASASAAAASALAASGSASAASGSAGDASASASAASGFATAADTARGLAVVAKVAAEAAQAAAEAAFVPDQTGHAGEFLTTNGTATAWASVAAKLIASSSTFPSPGVEFASIPAGYSELWLAWTTPLSAGTSVTFSCAFRSRTTGTWTSYYAIGSGTVGFSANLRGSMHLFGADQDQSNALASFTNGTGSGSLAGTTLDSRGQVALAGGCSGIRLQANGTGMIPTGSTLIRLYGRP